MAGASPKSDLQDVKMAEHLALPPNLLKKDGDKLVQVDAEEAVKGKFVGLYFSAHWCPPCRGFTPVLKDFYLQCKAKDKPLEIIFVSADNNPTEFEEYFREMPWLAVPYEKQGYRHALSRRHKVLGIPQLVIIGPEGNVLNKNARTALTRDPEGKQFPWIGQDDTGIGGMWTPILLLILCAIIYFTFFHTS